MTLFHFFSNHRVDFLLKIEPSLAPGHYYTPKINSIFMKMKMYSNQNIFVSVSVYAAYNMFVPISDC